MRTVAIVQARMANTRLPGKNGMLLLGQPQIYRVLERIKRMRCFHDIMLAVPHESNGGVLLEAAKALKIDTLDYRGDPNDVVRRYALAAEIMDASIIVRIPGDNTFTDVDEVERIVSHHAFDAGKWNQLTTNLDRDVLGNGYPAGLGAEVYDRRFIEWLDRNTTDKRHREHPHKWAFEHQSVRTVQCPDALRAPHLSLSVDTELDMQLTRYVYDSLYPRNPNFKAKDVLQTLGVCNE